MIAFTSQRAGDDGIQIYVISPTGGEARRVSNMADGAERAQMGRRLPHDLLDRLDLARRRRRRGPQSPEKSLKDAKSKAVVIDDTEYRVWDKWIADGKRPMIFATDVASGRHRNLLAKSKRFLPPTEPPPSANDYDVSPDGKELCFVSDSSEDYGLDFNSDLYTLNLDGDGEPKNITQDNDGERFQPGLQPRRQAPRVPAADDQVLLRRPPATHGARPGIRRNQGACSRVQPIAARTRNGPMLGA